MAEVERYQQLAQEKEALNERWDEQNSLLVESHERVIAELTEDYEAKLAEESLRLEHLLSEKAELEREFEEIKRQLEEDADREIEELKEKYEVGGVLLSWTVRWTRRVKLDRMVCSVAMPSAEASKLFVQSACACR